MSDAESLRWLGYAFGLGVAAGLLLMRSIGRALARADGGPAE